jgi:cobalt/nickel transport system permease protein
VHHVVLENWSRGASFLHHRDPRAKVAVLLVFLVVVATSPRAFPLAGAAWLLLLLLGSVVAHLPPGGTLLRACVVLPFSLIFAAITWFSGDPARAVSLLTKSYLSALAVLLAVATTPMPQLLRGLESFGVPRFLLMVTQFLYRYLFVISEEAQHMRTAALARGATARNWLARRERFRAAAGALAVLFARSYARAEEIHRAMLARGFAGDFRAVCRLRFRWSDGAFIAAACALLLAVRVLEAGGVL